MGPTPGEPGRDQVVLSRTGRELSQTQGTAPAAASTEAGSLDRQEMQELQQLEQRDLEVRTHEQAHLSAAGQYARGGASFTYQRGPDGVAYAVGGEVGIDVGKEANPEATIAKMQTVKRAALAPANPSAADRRIAAQATVKEAQARQELLDRFQEDLLHTESMTQDADASEPSAAGEVTGEALAASLGRLRAGIAAYRNLAGSRRP